MTREILPGESRAGGSSPRFWRCLGTSILMIGTAAALVQNEAAQP